MPSAVVPAGMNRESPESSSIPSSSGINYDVFLNFRGTDTRKGFTGHLYDKLVDAGLQVFKDDKELPAGGKITLELKEAIERSTISIAILSKDYASSRSCLMEVEQMWKCKELNGQTIIPIFYGISPSDVKLSAGDFKTSLEKHEKDGVEADTLKTWKNALRQIGGLSGEDLENIYGGDEAELVNTVVTRVRRLLKKDDQVVTDKLVGIELHVQEMMKLLGVVYSDGKAIGVCGKDVRVIGIHGMPGVGKTTLAKVVYNKIHILFDGCSFLEDINPRRVKRSQEVLIASLQKRKRERLNSSDDGIKKMKILFSNMKVLIVLDNVHDVEQIKGLAEKLVWFGPGSRIIVTTNTKNVLKVFDFGKDKDRAAFLTKKKKDRAAEEYEVKPMGDQDALQLFRKHAFQRFAPRDVFECESLSIDIVKAIAGIPFAIVLTASNLFFNGNDIEIWKETLDSLENNKDNEVKAAFETSYKYLDDDTKEIFLDIACFFIGKDKRIPYYMWKACGYYPSTGIKKLRDMHLLEDGENNELRMHNLLRDFGRKLVQKKALCERCRIWDHSDALPIPKDFKGTVSVKGIGLTVEEGCTDSYECEKFCEMSNLRYLRLDRAKIQGDTRKLPQNLRWLDWRECHSIPALCNMHLKKLVILDLSRSPVTKDSEFWGQIAKKVEELKVLNLQGCDKLHASFDFPAPVNLEILILEDCTQLSQIGPFISNLKNLSSLNLNNCSHVKKLPPELGCMKSLKELLIDGTGIKTIHIQEDSLTNLETLSARNCKDLEDISTIGSLRNLTSLALDSANIAMLPETFEFPQKLQRLSLRECKNLCELPPSIGNLRLLEVMDLSYTGITEMPPSVKDLSNLKTLKMERTYLENFPEDIVNLEKLEEIDFSRCRSLRGQVPCNISGLSSLKILRLSLSSVAGLPLSIDHLSRLQTLDILKCDRLHELPRLPSSLLSLRCGSKNMTIPDLSYLTNLKELCLTDDEQPKAGSSNQTPNIGWITRLPSLETLELSLPNVTNLPGDFSDLTRLWELSISYMKELDLTRLPFSSLWTLRLRHCKIQVPKFSSLKFLSELELDNCNLAKIDGLKDLVRLEVLKIFQRSSVTNLNELQELPRLRKVEGVFPAHAILQKLSHVELDIYDLHSTLSVA